MNWAALLFSFWLGWATDPCPVRVAEGVHSGAEPEVRFPDSLTAALSAPKDPLSALGPRQADLVLRFLRLLFRNPEPATGQDHPLFQEPRALATAQTLLAAGSSKPEKARALLTDLEGGALIPEAVFVTHQQAELQAETGRYLATLTGGAPVIALASDVFPISRQAFLDASTLIVPSMAGEMRLKPNVSRALVAGGYCEACLSGTIDSLIRNYSGPGEQEILIHPSHSYVGDLRFGRLSRQLAVQGLALHPEKFLELESVRSSGGTLQAEGPTHVETPYGPGVRWRMEVEGRVPPKHVNLIVLTGP